MMIFMVLLIDKTRSGGDLWIPKELHAGLYWHEPWPLDQVCN